MGSSTPCSLKSDWLGGSKLWKWNESNPPKKEMRGTEILPEAKLSGRNELVCIKYFITKIKLLNTNCRTITANTLAQEAYQNYVNFSIKQLASFNTWVRIWIQLSDNHRIELTGRDITEWKFTDVNTVTQ